MKIISYQKHETGNYIVKYDSQSIMILQAAFRSITGVSKESSSGCAEVDKRELSQLGFIV
ncbi:hypothetical protein PM3016_5456 [Paenibacillus mucilaginosus 3016]|uniref:Uncharacterized protein n=1 Tax=Paenibacillus mucilaginosus 3016 TaxID=1116391 RepID=H6NDV7_9BACL|nr:hypothetical protein PM3016_5456 [Paenibacillus mucilaginosus 3016]WFA20657.1 hypothetical protein ERY13_27160 [Paenibacillus mucilaginosus]